MTVLHVVSPSAAAGKTLWCVAFCRALRDRGHDVGVVKPVAVVDPSDVTRDGVSLAAAHLAAAASLPVSSELNPVVVTSADGHHGSVAIHGRRVAEVPLLGRDVALLDDMPAGVQTEVSDAIGSALERARERTDIVIVEGAGGVTDLATLGAWDPANIDVMHQADAAVLVARHSRGGAFAAIAGALQLVAPDLRNRITAFALNEVRTRLRSVEVAADRLAVDSAVEFAGLTPWLVHFAGETNHAPGTSGSDEDHRVLGQAFADNARWAVVKRLLEARPCSTRR